MLKYFLRKVRRKVRKEFSDVQVDAGFFRVDPQLRDDWVEVRYDPFSHPLKTVLIYSADGEYLGVGQRHERPNGMRPPSRTL